MADFKIALGITMGNEGGYNHGVGENETFFGIDRGFNGQWKGWAIVDQIRKSNPGLSDKQLNPIFKANTALITLKDAFYKSDFWDVLLLDQINDQQCANILFDDSVNPCEINAAHLMQTAAVNCGAKINVDGRVGNLTVSVVNSIQGLTYYNAVIAIRKFHYNHHVIVEPSQKQWLGSWLGRLKQYQIA